MNEMPGRLAYQPALDGLRALAVIAVVVFHAGWVGLPGGYLGVSVFFTLSGYLITTLLLREHDATGHVDLLAFGSQRIRRLLPASCICLAAIVIGGMVGSFDHVADLRRDIVAAALQLANWGQLTAGDSYADLFRTGTSPLAHYWSLAIEEQFYILWPVTLVALLGISRRFRWRPVVLICGGFVAAAIGAVLIGRRWGPDAVYFATPARAGELLAGSSLAAILRGREPNPSLRWLAPVALPIIVAAMVFTPAGRGWPYHGGLPIFAVVTAALIAGLQVAGPVRSMLAAQPLVRLGRISYGVYLFHWPVFVVVDERWGGAPGGVRFAVKCLITVAIAIPSYLFVERPVRRHRSGRRLAPVAGLAATAVLCAVALIVTQGAAPSFDPIDGARADAVAVRPPSLLRPLPPPPPVQRSSSVPRSPSPSTDPAGGASTTDVTEIVNDDPARILVVGDSTSLTLGAGLVDWAYRSDGAAQVTVLGLGGCGLVHEGLVGTVVDLASVECTRRVDVEVPEAISALQPDVVVISINVADNWDRSFDGGRSFVRPTDPMYSMLIRTRYQGFFATAFDSGATNVVWLNPPTALVYDRNGSAIDPALAAAGQGLVDDAIADAVANHPGRVRVLDLKAWLDATGILDDPGARPDGVHLSDAASDAVAARWLGPQLLAVAESGG